MAGSSLFATRDGELTLALHPALPGWLFDEQGEVSFKLLGSTEVTYVNPRHADTFGDSKAVIQTLALTFRDGAERIITGGLLRGADAEALRRGEIAAIRAVME